MHHGDDDQLGDADHDSLLMNSSPWFDPSGNDFTLAQLIILYREIANDQDLMTLILTMVAIASCAMMTTMMTMPALDDDHALDDDDWLAGVAGDSSLCRGL